ncbi:hypothetical protein B0T22DRAFT_486801 [Podospora appendiculata]|uniref:BZIP domain-containing protein n=1 Tax=Podospora appendiculata TaxID=314037 RepID=A0AAE0XGG5_9PEZI|nr:hypothetical protein B0T22DRAFT_486801 [Podospora appendiculata]
MPSRESSNMLVHKFSSKPPGHEAARLRENQRRHRARVKSQVAELQTSLSATQARLDTALLRIDELTAEVQRLRQTLPPSQPSPSGPSDSNTITTLASFTQAPDPLQQGRAACFKGDDAEDEPKTMSSKVARNMSNTDSPTVSTSEEQLRIQRHASFPPAEIDTDIPDPDSDHAYLPPPSPGESTIPCRDAFSILRERMLPGSDVEEAKKWLEPGFRRAILPGGGCRVQTHILFAFVDHITPVSPIPLQPITSTDTKIMCKVCTRTFTKLLLLKNCQRVDDMDVDESELNGGWGTCGIQRLDEPAYTEEWAVRGLNCIFPSCLYRLAQEEYPEGGVAEPVYGSQKCSKCYTTRPDKKTYILVRCPDAAVEDWGSCGKSITVSYPRFKPDEVKHVYDYGCMIYGLSSKQKLDLGSGLGLVNHVRVTSD